MTTNLLTDLLLSSVTWTAEGDTNEKYNLVLAYFEDQESKWGRQASHTWKPNYVTRKSAIGATESDFGRNLVVAGEWGREDWSLQ